MGKTGKKILKLTTALLLTVVLIIPLNVNAQTNSASDVMPEGSALQQNQAEDDVVLTEKYSNTDTEMVILDGGEKRVQSSGYVSKKGLQGANPFLDAHYADLGVTQTLYNCNLLDIIGTPSDHEIVYVYNGKTYYFNYIMGLSTQTHALNEAGIDISVVLLLPYKSQYANMIYSGARGDTGRTYYAWNLDDPETAELFEAIINFLADTYSKKTGDEWEVYIKNWIIGNEVNMPNHWNYTGTLDLNTNVNLYARQFKLVSETLARYSAEYNADMKAYISIEHSWMDNDEGRGIAGKTFIDAFAARLNEIAPGMNWNLAYHAYPAIMTDSNIWNSGYTTNDINTRFISGKNLNILTNYIKNTYGSDKRIILSEQGFTMSGGQYAQQAAALAYTYYMAEFDDMIDAVIFRSLQDNDAEAAQGFNFGLLNKDESMRPAYNVFKYMDTAYWYEYTADCLSTIGISDWAQVIPGFNALKFSNANGLCLGSDGNWHYYENGEINRNFVGMAENEYGWWYIRNGEIDWSFTGMAENEYGWWYFRNGAIDWSFTGMAENIYGWWYFRNGAIDWSFTGMAENEYGWWYFRNGAIDWSFTGMAENIYGWWYFRDGSIDWNYTGMAENEYGWWYIRNGFIDWSFTGIAENMYGRWYYQNGQIAWGYSGTVDYDGVTYTIVNGIVAE
ncbi:MAG: DUF5722 domain-containing protein [Alistipes sp.]|nr:DUF5722 domain-containing protein [Alistipes sp.]